MRTELSSIKELPEMHLMGHTCANLNGELFFVWGGSNENVSYLSVKNADLWIYETLTGYWRHRSCQGECPPYLSSPASALIGRKMYIFGGHSTAQDRWLNSLYCLDLETFVWTDLSSRARAEPTKPIRSDKCTGWAYQGKLYVFGGYGWSQIEDMLQLLDRQKDLQLTPDYRWPKYGWNNQLVEYDPRDNTWRWPSYKGNSPSARAAHSGALMGSKYYLFGGRGSKERLNDLYVLDMDTLEWSQIATFSSPDGFTVQRPIGHLNDPDDEEDNLGPQMEAENDAVMEEADQILNPANGSQDEPTIIEHLTPSPSSSYRPATHSCAPLINAQYFAQRGNQESRDYTATSSDDEDPEDGVFERPHPSHLLERWSPSSHQSASSSVAIDQGMSCDKDQQQETCNSTRQSTSTQGAGNEHTNERNEEPAEQSRSRANDDDRMDDGAMNLNNIDEAANKTDISRTPIGRSFASFTPISDHEILLYGGVSSQDQNLDDCWVFDISCNRWTSLNYKHKNPRLWHTGSRTKNNEVVIVGGSSSDKVDEFCTDVLSISMEPKSLRRLALDTAARSIRMKVTMGYDGLPSTVCKLIRLRKQAMALTMRRSQQQQVTR